MRGVTQPGGTPECQCGSDDADLLVRYTVSPHEVDQVDARAHHETWDDMVRLQAEGIYPAAFATIKVPIPMPHGTFDPLPRRLAFAGLRRYQPQLEYRELERCGHYPWLEGPRPMHFFSSSVSGWPATCTRPADDVLTSHPIKVRNGCTPTPYGTNALLRSQKAPAKSTPLPRAAKGERLAALGLMRRWPGAGFM
jgi:hypothetical protein